MEEKPTLMTMDSNRVNVIRLEEGDNSGCWICGGFSIKKKIKKNWHCYICSGHETIQENGIETHCKYCILPPFHYNIHSYEKDITTGQYRENNKKSCWFYLFSCGKEVKGHNPNTDSDECCSCFWSPHDICSCFCYPDSQENIWYRDLKCSCIFGPGCCYNISKGKTINKTLKTSSIFNPFYYSRTRTEENNDDKIKLEENFNCCWSPISYKYKDNTKVGDETKKNNKYCCLITPFNFYNKKIEDKNEYSKKVFCVPPFCATDETQMNDKIENKTICGLCPFFCYSIKENDNEYQKDVCGSLGFLSYCKTTNIKDNVRSSNYCITCLFGTGFCKRGRCCKLTEENSDNSNNCCTLYRYLKPSEYEFFGKVDNLRTKSCTCLGLGNCEIIPINKTANFYAPSQEEMNETITIKIDKEEDNVENITSAVRIRSMFGEKTIYSKYL